eukprot:74222-Chlamydomonas_euryale.AAC.2
MPRGYGPLPLHPPPGAPHLQLDHEVVAWQALEQQLTLPLLQPVVVLGTQSATHCASQRPRARRQLLRDRVLREVGEYVLHGQLRGRGLGLGCGGCACGRSRQRSTAAER